MSVSLFDDTSLGELRLNSRVGLAPMTRTSANADGTATTEMARYYAKFAEGGFSLLITEGTYPEVRGQGYDNQPGLATDEQAAEWETVTEAVHAAGSPIIAQLMHAGPLTQAESGEPVAPSPVTPKGEQLPLYGGDGPFSTPRKLTTDELDDVRESFVAAAERAADAGFDGVEIHGANGYLLDTFLSRHLNDRTDAYGGSPAARARFPTEVLNAVIEATPDDFVVGIRLSQTKVNDEDHRWNADEAESYLSTLDDGDYVHVTDPDITTAAFPETDQTLAELAADHAETRILANGGLGDPADARDAIESGADLITVARSALANPDWPTRVAAGEELTEFDFEDTLLPEATLNSSEIPAESPADD
ncbi:NADH:flavin oxidoreductase [Natrinema sp. 74]|uniref:oxidoreductase n=1 Tax=Natrinema sp. 74 TaxID=3384159 RepID=UPI0038D3B855